MCGIVLCLAANAFPAGRGAFRLDGPTGGSAIGELVKFSEGPDGKVQAMTIGLSPSERVR